jgi:hypothetical protein
MRTKARKMTRTRTQVRTTLGELIVAAFDTAGNQITDVARLLASPELGRAAHGRIVLVQ